MTGVQYARALDQLASLVADTIGATLATYGPMTVAAITVPLDSVRLYTDWIPCAISAGAQFCARPVGAGCVELSVTVMDEEAMGNIGPRLAECGGSGHAPDARCTWCGDSTELGYRLGGDDMSLLDPHCEACDEARTAADRARVVEEARGDAEYDQWRDRQIDAP